LLRYVEAFISANRYSPSTRELAREFGTSTSVINYRLDRLVKEGKLQRVPMIARGILLVEEDEQ
jgi:DNA-binding Lrp family transcriptional regulator